MGMVLNVLFALSITLMIEPIIVSSMKKFDMKLFITSFGLNVILNATMNCLLIALNQDHYYVYLAIFEFATVIIETLMIFMINKTDLQKTLLFVLLANLASFLVGYILNKVAIYRNVELILTIVFYVIASGFLAFTAVLFALHYEDNKNHQASDNNDNGNGEDKDC